MARVEYKRYAGRNLVCDQTVFSFGGDGICEVADDAAVEVFLGAYASRGARRLPDLPKEELAAVPEQASEEGPLQAEEPVPAPDIHPAFQQALEAAPVAALPEDEEEQPPVDDEEEL